MAELVGNCPRCGAKQITFDLISEVLVAVEYGWQNAYESFCICRNCNKTTTFLLYQKDRKYFAHIEKGLSTLGFAVNRIMNIRTYISLKDKISVLPPEYLPEKIEAVFREGAACLAIGCFNAAGCMFRLCIGLATKDILPPHEVEGLNARIRRNLGLRLPWLFDNQILPEALRELSSCIKDDGNDAAHEGTLSEEDAGDISDFTYALLERIYTEPRKITLAKERSAKRRSKGK